MHNFINTISSFPYPALFSNNLPQKALPLLSLHASLALLTPSPSESWLIPLTAATPTPVHFPLHSFILRPEHDWHDSLSRRSRLGDPEPYAARGREEENSSYIERRKMWRKEGRESSSSLRKGGEEMRQSEKKLWGKKQMMCNVRVANTERKIRGLENM